MSVASFVANMTKALNLNKFGLSAVLARDPEHFTDEELSHIIQRVGRVTSPRPQNRPKVAKSQPSQKPPPRQAVVPRLLQCLTPTQRRSTSTIGMQMSGSSAKNRTPRSNATPATQRKKGKTATNPPAALTSPRGSVVSVEERNLIARLLGSASETGRYSGKVPAQPPQRVVCGTTRRWGCNLTARTPEAARTVLVDAKSGGDTFRSLLGSKDGYMCRFEEKKRMGGTKCQYAAHTKSPPPSQIAKTGRKSSGKTVGEQLLKYAARRTSLQSRQKVERTKPGKYVTIKL